MYKGELKERGERFYSGHQKGIIRAYDDLITEFSREFPKDHKELEFIKNRKEFFIEYCEAFGYGEE